MVSFPSPVDFIASSTIWASALFSEFLSVIAVLVGLAVAGLVLHTLRGAIIGVPERIRYDSFESRRESRVRRRLGR